MGEVARWRGAARRFRGTGKHLKAQAELRNIRLHPIGYQVVFHRESGYVSRCFPGFDHESLERAKRFRDEVEREKGKTRKNRVPAAVLRALGLTEEAHGVSRLASRSVYRVEYREPDGRRRVKQFYFRRVPEVDAYAAAAEFVRELKAGRTR